MHALWSGSISFGLVNIPIKLYAGSQDKVLDLTMLHKKDKSPIRYAKICRAENKEIPYTEIVKGYEYEKGEFVVLEDKDFEKANVRATHLIDIVQFSDQQDIDPRYFLKPYYLEPGKGADKAYALLRDALSYSKKVGIATFVIRNKPHLAVIKALDEVLLLNTLRFADEVRSLKDLDLPEKSATNKKELDLALSLIDQLDRKFNPKEFHDNYTEELEKIISARAKGKTPVAKGKLPKDTRVKDLMATLRASLKEPKKPTTRHRKTSTASTKKKAA